MSTNETQQQQKHIADSYVGSMCRVPSESEKAELLSKFEENCKQAANTIKEADVLVLLTGAGMSADSGLATYREIANVKVYETQGLTYRDLCNPSLIESDPSLFWGFWGACYNDYTTHIPHQGYQIINNWRKTMFESSMFAQSLTRHLDKNSTAKEGPGAFFAFTSNVDDHLQDVFGEPVVYACHGSARQLQCSIPCCQDATWKLNSEFRFTVNRETMRLDGPNVNLAEYYNGTDSELHCSRCGALARPSVLMFDDISWVENSADDWHAFLAGVVQISREQWKWIGGPSKLVLLEIGCGATVPTVRCQSMDLLVKFNSAEYSSCSLVRINPDFPLPDRSFGAEACTRDNKVISIQSTAMHALKSINDAM